MALSRHLKGDGLRSRALRGAAISIGGTAGQQALRLVSNLILTRLLFPEAFGLMTLVQTFMTGLAMFSDVGIHPAIVRSPRGDDPDFLNTAWTIQIGRGIMLWIAACAIAWPAAHFYQTPQLRWMLPVVGLNAVIQGFQSTKNATAGRHMLLGRQTLIALGTQLLCLMAMIGLAFAWPSVWALVIGGLLGALLGTIASHLFLTGHPNRLRWDRNAVHELTHFGRFIFVSTIAGFFVGQGDKLIMGRLISLADLGIYNIAFFMAAFPGMFASVLANRILFPLYREIRPSESAENRRKIGRARLLLGGMMIVLLGLIAIIGIWLIGLLYDQRYHAAGPMLVVLAIMQMPTGLVLGNSQLLLAEGNSKDFSKLMVTMGVLTLVFMVAGFWLLGIFGILLTAGMVVLVTYPLQQMFLARHGGIDLRGDGALALLGLGLAIVAVWLNWTDLAGFIRHVTAEAPLLTGNWTARDILQR